ncbi:PBSP domain protein [Myriangium duriaei CBS 260.36]|uniref:PBSP domain protein n=1 Tax=Myriangium duriaei CBS 260.36 TaxID=1168546 RepID=A0A9P4MGL3_9PEZI|nr:PBSP domain protein [Myriangium duriaei CBS 260.36]
MLKYYPSGESGEQIQPPTPLQPNAVGSDGVPQPLLRMELRDLRHGATKVFLNNFQPTDDVTMLISTVLEWLYEGHVPPVRSIMMVIRDMDGVAYTTGIDIDPQHHKEIDFSLSYIQHVAKSSPDPAAIRKELLGVICHELVHCWQYDGQGTAPGGLIEGVADWVRLNAGYVPPHWGKDCQGDWHKGYQTTAYFLDWVEKQQGKGSVRRINEKLRVSKYDEKTFWPELFKKDVKTMWDAYCKSIQ